MRLFHIVCVTFLLAVTSFGIASAAEPTSEPLEKIKENLDAHKAVLVDVREQSEWDNGHVKDAILLPISSLRDGVSADELEVLPKMKVVYLHCAVGKRAVIAGGILERCGIDVRPLKHGYRELIEAGFPKAEDN